VYAIGVMANSPGLTRIGIKNETKVIKSVCEELPTYTTIHNLTYECPCNNCVVKAMCSQKCAKFTSYIRTILNDYYIKAERKDVLYEKDRNL